MASDSLMDCFDDFFHRGFQVGNGPGWSKSEEPKQEVKKTEKVRERCHGIRAMHPEFRLLEVVRLLEIAINEDC